MLSSLDVIYDLQLPLSELGAKVPAPSGEEEEDRSERSHKMH